MFVVNAYHHKKDKMPSKMNLFERKVKQKALKRKIQQETLPSPFDKDDGTSQFSLMCKKAEIDYRLLIQAACNEDFPLKPKFRNKAGLEYPDVFFVNQSNHLIFFIYDNRGCEVIANDKETICFLYEKYDNLIDEVERAEMEAIFKKVEE
ncbi:DUF3885 domain-containing protein [Gracilibacillus sp. S3-1-1]|uniref:DUF3885 domain-containing protein n=1 Tax=Gracilibacillus pellucidus TaxID=3095368 RepID=A0ACC6M8A1_9BACI|nr:DUF3885 domain-containing protein [Gracilibacillus sp. S3-1-1]MDX8047211.1 DUF3885 domain-containing protein [Gracilibacillus sp. S3-1-1]